MTIVKQDQTSDSWQQYQAWKTDLSRVAEFKNFKVLGNSLVIEVYREETTEATEKVNLIVGQSKGGGLELKSEKVGALIQPLAKVLAVGDNMQGDFWDIKVGDIVYLPDSLKSVVDSPDYLSLLMGSKGNEKPNIPKGMVKTLYAFDDRWRNYRFRLDKFGEMRAVDTVTFLIPAMSTMIVGKEIQ